MVPLIFVIEVDSSNSAVERSGPLITMANASACERLGYREHELVGQPISIIFDNQDEACLFTEQDLKEILSKGSIGDLEKVLRTKEGQHVPVWFSASILSDQRGTKNLVCIAQDLAERRQNEDRLVSFSRVLEQSPAAIVITDTQGNIEYVNPKFTQLTGYSAQEVIGGNPRVLQSGMTSSEEYQRLWETLLTGGEWQGEVQNKKKNGECYWARQSISAIRNAQGVITHWLVIEEDITERKRIEQALRESEARFRQIADMTGEWIWEQDPSGHYTYSSAAVKQILGYEPEEIIGKHYYELFTQEDRQQWLAEIPEATTIKERFFRLLNHYRHKDGHEVLTESTGEPLFDEQGDLIKWRGVDRDITERIKAEEMIRRAHVKLAVARNEMKLARQIQESLLPSTPLILPEVQVMGCCLPAAQIGGDYFDYFHEQDDSVEIVIADVSGHSVGSALFMVEIRSALKTQVRLRNTVANTLAVLNDSLYEDLDHADHFITVFYMQYNTLTRQLNYANAGHIPPLLVRRDTSVCTRLDADGLILGVKKGVCFEEKTVLLEKGDIVFLYTDGVTEAENKAGEFFGTERLGNLLISYAHLEPQELIRKVIKKLQAFGQRKTFNDDVTMVIMKVR